MNCSFCGTPLSKLGMFYECINENCSGITPKQEAAKRIRTLLEAEMVKMTNKIRDNSRKIKELAREQACLKRGRSLLGLQIRKDSGLVLDPILNKLDAKSKSVLKFKEEKAFGTDPA